MKSKREHWGACLVRRIESASPNSTAWPYPTMEGAIEALDPFNSATYWPLRNVVPYLGRMGRDGMGCPGVGTHAP